MSADILTERLESKPEAYYPVTQVIATTDLPLYKEAGKQTGFGIVVLAREGQKHNFWYTDSQTSYGPTLKTITVDKDKIAVEITKPADSKTDHTPFWDKLQNLQKPQV